MHTLLKYFRYFRPFYLQLSTLLSLTTSSLCSLSHFSVWQNSHTFIRCSITKQAKVIWRRPRRMRAMFLYFTMGKFPLPIPLPLFLEDRDRDLIQCDPRNQHPKQNLDPFSCFCTAQPRDLQTN